MAGRWGYCFGSCRCCTKPSAKGRLRRCLTLQVQYADYAVWQRGWLQGEVLESQLRYWKQQLEGAPQVLELPTDRPRPAVQTFRGERRSVTLSRELSEGLKRLSRAEGVTLFMTLLAAFQALLYRYTGQEDLVVGSPIANRNRAEIEGLIGFFVNTLVLRTDLSGSPSFQELLRRVRSTCLEAYAHQDLPFEKLVEELQPERNLNRTPLFQVMLNLLNLSDDSLELAGLEVEHIRRTEVVPKFDMDLYVTPNEEGVRLNLVFDTDLFDPARMDEMLEQFKHLVEQIVEAPQQSIRYYSLVTERSREFLPDPTEVLPQPHMAPVTSEFLSWVKQSPQQKAVVQGSRSWSYEELSASAHSLAHALAVHGIKHGDVAAVAGPRSFGLIASVVSVFLSGGVLLTIDRNQPSHRQRLMMSEAGVKYLFYVGDWRQEDEWLRQLPVLTIIHVASQEGAPPPRQRLLVFRGYCPARGFIGRPRLHFLHLGDHRRAQRSIGLSQGPQSFLDMAEEHVRYRTSRPVCPTDELVLRSCSPGHIPAVSQRSDSLSARRVGRSRIRPGSGLVGSRTDHTGPCGSHAGASVA